MSSYYDDASLVMIPSGYKTSKVYSVKPTDGTGDLTFTRTGDTASRIGPNGLIEKVRTNIILQSNGFNTATWNKSGAGTGLAPVVTANAGTAPDGTNNAFRIQFNCVGTTSADRSRLIQTLTTTTSVPYVSSFYIKAFSAGEVGKQVRFIPELAGVQSIVTLTADWQRVFVAGVASTTSMNFTIETRGTFTTNTTADVLLAFTQVETGDIATDYIATTTAAVSVGPVANVPRLDYLNSSCGRLLLEGQRTNSVTSSENIATGWTYTNTAISVNQTASPDGYANADAIVPDATSGQHAINSANITASGSFTLSAFVKAGEYTKVAIRESANTGSYASFNLATGTKIEDSVSGASFIQSYGNGWYRIGVTGTFSGTIRLGINVLSNAYTTGNPSSGTTFFSGNASDKLFCWGMQAELGATYATSYTPTLGAAVTRGADAASKTGISSLIGQTEGVLFVDFVPNNTPASGVQQWLFFLGSGSAYIAIFISSGQKLRANVANTTDQAVIDTSFNLVAGTRYKAAFAYKENDFAFYVNGVQIGIDTSGTVPALSTLQNNYNTTAANSSNAGLNQALLFKTRLSNSSLAELTSL